MRGRGLYRILIICLLVSCTRDLNITEEPAQVGFYAGYGHGDETISRAFSGGYESLSSFWEEEDELGLWAFNPNGGKELAGERFCAYGIGSSEALFTSTLSAPMRDGVYKYVATYPVPYAVEGNTAYFTVPAVQDGSSGHGEDIMISDIAQGGPLKPIDWATGDGEELHLCMNHLLHRFRFYTDSPSFEGEAIQRLTVEFPKPVAGNIAVDVSRPSSGISFSGSDKVLDIIPSEPVPVSTASKHYYITASIVPTSFKSGEEMVVTVYTETKTATSRISLMSRSFNAGHSTPVRLAPSAVEGGCRLKIKLVSNNLGEPVENITIKAPEGCAMGDDGSRSITLKYGKDISLGGTFNIDYENESLFRSLGGKSLEIEYESGHVITSEAVTVPDLSSKSVATIGLNVPYLLSEDFSTVPGFSSDDEYQVSSAGSKDAHSFLGGWTGARIGAGAGESIRLACRRETSVDYDARVESAPLNAQFKSETVLKVSFDYGADEENGGILPKSVGQNCYIGYVTSLSAYKSGSTAGVFDRDKNTFYIKESDGSYTNTPHHAEYFISVGQGVSPVRISWRTEVEHMAGMNNNTVWLYIDNVKVEVCE